MNSKNNVLFLLLVIALLLGLMTGCQSASPIEPEAPDLNEPTDAPEQGHDLEPDAAPEAAPELLPPEPTAEPSVAEPEPAEPSLPVPVDPQPDASATVEVPQPAPEPTAEELTRILDREIFLFRDNWPDAYSSCFSNLKSMRAYTESWTFRALLNDAHFDRITWAYTSITDAETVIRFTGVTNTLDIPWEVTINFTLPQDGSAALISYYLNRSNEGAADDVFADEYAHSPLDAATIATEVDATASCFLVGLDYEAMETSLDSPTNMMFDPEHIYSDGDSFTVTGYLEYSPEPGGWSEDYCYIETANPIKFRYLAVGDVWEEWEDTTIYFLLKEDVAYLKPYVGMIVTITGTFNGDCHGIPYLTETVVHYTS